MGKLVYTNEELEQEISIKVDDYATIEDFIYDGVAPLMYAMGYMPTNVAEALSMTDVLDIYRKYQGVSDE